VSLAETDSGYKPPFEPELGSVPSGEGVLEEVARIIELRLFSRLVFQFSTKSRVRISPSFRHCPDGPIGSGKSSLVRELVTNFIRQGCSLLYYCIDDPADIVKLGLEDHHIAVDKIEQEGRLEFVTCSP